MPDWTAEQERAISLKNRKLLVSAAAGSGKIASCPMDTSVSRFSSPWDASPFDFTADRRSVLSELHRDLRKTLSAVQQTLNVDPLFKREVFECLLH